ncbi:uncharacterized protein FIESC28_10986 [Fusarium coffeatum]|uniref:Uncharacterized protein n=1 Tax=Fusarium coffeatum TaxID=231269 RepID=A0A366QNU4_9HYPO|nr:uncharacterized protein FIESC28_10986 [Fusarium coffeatum]RBR06591.1 hypothetical protein FIESC28_10986 [Fusarium coffeatum]
MHGILIDVYKCAHCGNITQPIILADPLSDDVCPGMFLLFKYHPGDCKMCPKSPNSDTSLDLLTDIESLFDLESLADLDSLDGLEYVFDFEFVDDSESLDDFDSPDNLESAGGLEFLLDFDSFDSVSLEHLESHVALGLCCVLGLVLISTRLMLFSIFLIWGLLLLWAPCSAWLFF